MGVTFRLIIFITTFATYALSLSAHQTAKKNLPINPKSGNLSLSTKQQTSSMNRRSYLSSVLNGCGFALAVGSRPTYAAQEESSTPCTSACMYECKARVMGKKGRPTSRDRLIQECKEQCQGDRESCHGIPPQRKQEPQLLQSKRITGLYPRWQDDF